MIKAIISDFSRTLLFPKDKFYKDSLNQLYKDIKDSVDFSFFDHFVCNTELAKLYAQIKKDYALDIYIFTTDKIQEDPALISFIQEPFTGIFTVSDVDGLGKDNPQAYTILSQKLNIPANELLFIDDSDANINAAVSAGLNTIKYSNIEHLCDDFVKYI